MGSRALFALTSELLVAIDGAPPRLTLFWPAGSPLSLPSSNLDHPSLIQRPRFKDTPSPVILDKETPDFYKIIPTVLGRFKIRFYLLLIQKSSSIYLQNCHYLY